VTPRQAALWRFIAAYEAEHGYGPSWSEMAAGIGYRSKGCITPMLGRMKAQGILTWTPNANRSVRLLRSPKEGMSLPGRSHLMWGMKTSMDGREPTVQPLSLAFFKGDVPNRMRLDPTIAAELVRVRVTIEEIEEEA